MPRRLARALALVALLVTAVGASPTAAAPSEQVGCRFVMGFAALRDLVGPEQVGACLENEHHDPANGDARQRTTGGLLVWRKADNATAFTDGFRTWVNGPRGLQRRLNTERFDWEGGAEPTAGTAATACSIRGGAEVRVERQVPAAEGAVEVSGTVTNRCAEPIDVVVDVVARSVANSPGSRPVVDAPSALVTGVEVGGRRPFTVRLAGAAGAPTVTAEAFAVPVRQERAVCMDVGASACLMVDRRLVGAVAALMPFEPSRALVRGAAVGGVAVGMAELPRTARGAYSTRRRAVVIADSLMDSTTWVRAAVLVHELQHAADHRGGLLPTREPQQCLRLEETAFRMTAAFWTWIWGDRFPPAIDDMHGSINGLARTSRDAPERFVAGIAEAYHDSCGTSG